MIDVCPICGGLIATRSHESGLRHTYYCFNNNCITFWCNLDTNAIEHVAYQFDGYLIESNIKENITLFWGEKTNRIHVKMFETTYIDFGGLDKAGILARVRAAMCFQ